MPAPNTISADKLAKLIGTPSAPAIIDVRDMADFDFDPLLIPTAKRKASALVAQWAGAMQNQTVVVVCHRGHKLSHGVAAYLRHEGVDAVSLEDGFTGWKAAGLSLVPAAKLPNQDEQGRTVWVTRSRPKIDRIACPWLIRRFIDSDAVFLFVPTSEVKGVAERFGATPFDIEETFWSHRGELCTFDVMLEELGLKTAPLLRLANVIRGADTGRLDLAPEAAGLLAASLGLSRIYADDLEQLQAGMLLYDAFYRWCRDATEETHNWPTNKAKT
jgi:rhodanese-related sulfurtransferase